MTHNEQPGSRGEHALQREYGTRQRAEGFYERQMCDRLIPTMQEFIGRQEMVFVATADSRGECDCSFRAGEPGFVRVLDENTLLYPEFRGNGVMASLGNLSENPHMGMLFIDFLESTVGLHVNGTAQVLENAALLERPALPEAVRAAMGESGGRRPERWVQVAVEEAYIHCSKHIPLLARRNKTIAWGTDDARLKGGDFFKVSRHQGSPSGSGITSEE